MTGYENVARLRLAIVRYRRFVLLKAVLSVLWFVVGIVAVIAVWVTHGILWAALAFFIGLPVATAVVTPLVTLPLTFAICGGRDAMRLGAALDKARRGDFSALNVLMPQAPEAEIAEALRI